MTAPRPARAPFARRAGRKTRIFKPVRDSSPDDLPTRLAHKTCPDDLPIRVYADISTFDCGGDPSAREISVNSGKTVASGRAGGVITAKRRVFELREELICSLSKFYAVPKFFGLRLSAFVARKFAVVHADLPLRNVDAVQSIFAAIS